MSLRDPRVQPREFALPLRPKLRVLAIDGGGIRGLIAAIVLERLEELIRERDPQATLASSFDLIAGTSTGGLIALGLATPGADGRPVLSATETADIYRGERARAIFSRTLVHRLPLVGRALELVRPKYGLGGLRTVLAEIYGGAAISEALTGLLLTTYDVENRRPRILKPWLADAGEISCVEAGLATAAAPTYFPPLRGAGGTLVDGGVFSNNPVIAATVEALKRQQGEPLGPEDLLVVSLGTGRYERGFDPGKASRWGQLGWILPKSGEPPLISSMLDGQSDSADHWAHMLLNHVPGTRPDRGEALGAGPRYYRMQIDLDAPLPLDGAAPAQIDRLSAYGRELRDAREAELGAIAAAVTGPAEG